MRAAALLSLLPIAAIFQGCAGQEDPLPQESCSALSAEYSESYGENTTNVTIVWPNGYEVAFFEDETQARCSQSWVNIPGINLFSSGGRAFLYALALAYAFTGIAVIADIFMASVEQICAQTKEFKLPDGRVIEAQIWNATVANLTLMALGSSAPEIMLAIVEAVQNLGKFPGELGPSTIVGSAAFNLLVITAVCIVSLPGDEIKKISDITVFAVTATWSILVYLWMFVVLDVWTPGVVSAAEAWITLLAMGVFVAHSYCQDRRWFTKKDDHDAKEEEAEEGKEIEEKREHKEEGGFAHHVIGFKVTDPDGSGSHRIADKEEIKKMMRDMKRENPKAQLPTIVSSVALAMQGSTEDTKKKSWLFWRINTRNKLMAKKHVATKEEVDISRKSKSIDGRSGSASANGSFRSLRRPSMSARGASTLSPARGSRKYSLSADNSLTGSPHRRSHDRSGEQNLTPQIHECRAAFTTHDYRVIESGETVRLAVLRSGDDVSLSCETQVDYETHDGTALAGVNYEAVKGTVTFRKGEIIQYIEVPIIDNDEPNPDLTFTVIMSHHREKDSHDEVPTMGSMGHVEFKLGAICLAQVLIIDDDHPGTISFEDNQVPVLETSGTVDVKVIRTGGAAGLVAVDYYTSDGSAVAGVHYTATKGTIEFAPKATEAEISIPIINNDEINPDTTFHVMLANPTNLATIGRQSIAMVQIKNDDGLDAVATELHNMLLANKDASDFSTNSWMEQLMDALNPEGGVDEDGEELELGLMDYFMHYLTIFWKLVFVLCPPTAYCGGWLTFVVSLIFIGALTAVVGELASLFGCSVGLLDSVTAITFVALGTSLPDMFASRSATQEAPDADAAIGNVTGSNTVNVLLGLGLPWVIGTIYYGLIRPDLTGGLYCVPSGTLAYSVMVFSCCAAACVILIFVRRYAVGGELGGPGAQKWASAIFLIVLWLFYVIMSSLQSYGYITFGTFYELDDFGCRVGQA